MLILLSRPLEESTMIQREARESGNYSIPVALLTKTQPQERTLVFEPGKASQLL
jgi:hypothetical protein